MIGSVIVVLAPGRAVAAAAACKDQAVRIIIVRRWVIVEIYRGGPPGPVMDAGICVIIIGNVLFGPCDAVSDSVGRQAQTRQVIAGPVNRSGRCP